MSHRSRSPRIAFCLPALARGGMEQVTLTLIDALIEQGYAVDLVLEREHGEYLNRLAPAARLFVWQKHSKLRAYSQLIRAWPCEGLAQLGRRLVPRLNHLPLRRVPSMAAYLREQSPDIVFASHGRIPILTLLAKRIARVDIPIVVVEHSTLSRWLDVFRDEPAKHRRWQYRYTLARRYYPLADRVAGVSNGVTADLTASLELDPRRAITLYNPVIAETTLTREFSRPDHPWFAPGEPPVVLAVGRLVAEKNFSALIAAFIGLRTRRRARLMILGEGDRRAALERQIQAAGLEADIALLGWVDDPLRYMAHSAVFVLSSWFEGLGLVLIEAMAAGCPVVSFDIPSGPGEILERGRYGRLVPPHDIEALINALITTFDSPRRAQALRDRARDFSIDKGVAGYRRLIETLVSSADD